MPSFFNAMAMALRSGQLPEEVDMDVIASHRDDPAGWYSLSPAEQQAMVSAVRHLFQSCGKCVIRYSPMLQSSDIIYRPIGCVPESVIRTLLSGEQDLYSFDETGESCQWIHVFTEEGGLSHVTIIGLDYLAHSRARPRSRSRSNSRSRKRRRDASPAPSRVRPKHARQNAVGFFPFTLDPVAARFVDLSHAQIFTVEQSQYQVRQCLIASLEYFDVDTTVLSEISASFENFAVHVPKKCFKYVAEKCNLRMHITYYRNDLKKGTSTSVVSSDDPDAREVHLGVFCDHIFPDVEIPASMFVLRNLDKVASLVDDGKISRERLFHVKKIYSGRVHYSQEAKTMKTSQVIRTLYSSGHFKPIDMSKVIQTKQTEDADIVLNETHFEICQREWQYRAVGSREEPSDVENETDDIESKGGRVTQVDNSYIYFAADYEAYVQGESHEPCLAGAMELDLDSTSHDTDPSHVHVFEGSDVTRDLFSYIVTTIRGREKKMGSKLTHKVVYFHNLKYDRTLFEKHPEVKVVDVCDKDSAVYSLKIRFMGCAIQIRDSAKLIPLALRQFASNFNLPASLEKKDYSVYTHFAPVNARDDFTCTVRQYVSSQVFDGDREKDAAQRQEYCDRLTLYLQALVDVPVRCSGACCAEDRFHPWILYKDYMRYDVLILAAGLLTFRREMHVITDNMLDALQSLTLPSFANRYMAHNDAFVGMYELSGALRKYQMQAVAGGRVYVNPKYEGRHLRGKYAYMDAVGLYPSAIAFQCEELGGFPVGPAALLTPEQLNYAFLKDHTTDYTCTISITAIDKKQQDIPFIRVLKKNGMDYVNDLPDGKPLTCVVDRVTLEDWIEFHDIKFNVIQGMYWTGPGNCTFGAIQRKIHTERAAAKRAGEVARGNLYKLIGNSAYGKLLQKSAPTDKLMIPVLKTVDGDLEEQNFRLALYNNLHLIKSFRFVGEHQIEATRYKMDQSFTLCHVGSKVLAASKRLMNRLFNLASEMGLNLYYTDTDSFVCDHGVIPTLAAAFAVRYGFPLLGTEMMKFHSDFTFKLPNGKALDPERVYSTEFWPMGKKLYCHALEGETEDGEIVHDIQFKCKGATHEGLVYKAREYGPNEKEGVLGLYMNLSMGEDIEVPLNPPGKTRFVYDKNNRVSTHGKIFYRNLRSAAAQRRITQEREEEKERKLANPPVYACPECEYERVTGHIQSQHKHTCHQDPPEELSLGDDLGGDELEGGFCRE